MVGRANYNNEKRFEEGMMNRLISGLLVILSLLCIQSDVLAQEWTPFQLSIFKSVQLFPAGYDVNGIRTNLFYGRNSSITGLDFGFGYNDVMYDFLGAQAGLINNIGGSFGGIQLSPFWNWVNKDFLGVQIAPIGINAIMGCGTGIQVAAANMIEKLNGLQLAFYMNTGQVKGIQIAGIANGVWGTSTTVGNIQYIRGGNDPNPIMGIEIAGAINQATTVKGLQVAGLYNKVITLGGLQLSAFNVADKVTGTQIGIINYCEDMYGLQFGVINVIRNGFVPVFPAINFSF